eukprot:TRINITY_DN967_c0_g2_i6.p2 TRINITY_DN967_c0_g2~~TRINITY_DN967_c0_g2_i6.p2  ORF type:complete len:104 (+),score=6.83 TRINITY_DN967_c0_g2_i6:263-574(+)
MLNQKNNTNFEKIKIPLKQTNKQMSHKTSSSSEQQYKQQPNITTKLQKKQKQINAQETKNKYNFFSNILELAAYLSLATPPNQSIIQMFRYSQWQQQMYFEQE